MTRLDMPWGVIEIGNNEGSIISTVPDPPKLRLAAAEGGSIGAVSWNRLRADGAQEEMVLLQGKQDERERGTNVLSGEVTLHVRNGRIANDDAAMIKIIEFRCDGIGVYVPVTLR